ncbi:MAG: hypothetical protein ACLSVD_00695 [Eggerthellaceae bacterium]
MTTTSASYGALTVTGEAFDYAAQHGAIYTANIGNCTGGARPPRGIRHRSRAIRRERRRAHRYVYLHFAGGDTGWAASVQRAGARRPRRCVR